MMTFLTAIGPKLSRFLRVSSLVIGAALVWLSSLSWPVPFANGLDVSWSFVLGFARMGRLQFGTDLLFTYGPWGFLSTIYCHPDFFWQHLVWEFVFKAGLAVTVALCAARLPWWRGLLLFAVAAVLQPLFGDVPYSFFIAALLWANAVTDDRAGRFLPAVSGVVLSFFALQKFTFFLSTGAGIVGVGCVLIARHRKRPAIFLAGGWFAGLLAGWLAAGQPLGNLMFFITRSAALAAAYQDAMGLDEAPKVFWCGVATLGAGLLAAWSESRRHADWPLLARWALVALAGGLCFLVWKNSFVRADGHVLGLFLFAALAGLAARHGLGLVLATVAVIGFWMAEPGLLAVSHYLLRAHLQDSVTHLAHLRDTRAAFLAQTEKSRAAQLLPLLHRRIGGDTVDVFGHEQVVAYWNRLNYRPRPIFQGYPVVSGSLAQINADFYASAKAPRFVLVRLHTIDGRLAAIDDARALLSLIERYEFDAEEQGWLLLRRRTSLRKISIQPLSTQLHACKDMATVPQFGGLVWAEVELRPSWWGSLRAFLYKPNIAMIRIETKNGVENYRLAPRASAGGFLLSPVLASTEDLRSLITGRPGRAALAVGIEAGATTAQSFAKTAAFRFGTVPSPAPDP
jgi:hypothetical protein